MPIVLNARSPNSCNSSGIRKLKNFTDYLRRNIGTPTQSSCISLGRTSHIAICSCGTPTLKLKCTQSSS